VKNHRKFFFLLTPLIFSLLLGCSNALESGDIVYLAKGAHNRYQLFSLNPADRNPVGTPLTQLDTDILDFTINDYQEIAFTTADLDESSDIWLLVPNDEEPQKVVDCVEVACKNPRWSPKLALFIYEKRPIINGEVRQETPTLWWFDLPTGQSVAVFDSPDWIGQDARFSADGESITYVVPIIDEAQIFHIPTGEISGISSRTGTPLEWGLGDDIYFSALLVRNERAMIHILKTNRDGNELIDLSGTEAVVEDAGYLVSPSGEQLLFTRKPPRSSSGRQIWVMGINGEEPRSLTAEQAVQHGAVSWSNDGRQLLYQRFDLTELNAKPAIWTIDIETEKTTFLTAGTRPQWVP
jgi:Tol biopolymer transport system component